MENIKYNELIDKLEILNKKIEDLNVQIHEIFNKYNSLPREKLTNDVYEEKNAKIDELYTKEYLLNKKIEDLQYELFWIKSPIKNNGTIDIRKIVDGNENSKNSITGTYSICLSKEKKVIGEISYRGYHINEFLADIGYRIEENYRGKNYSYQALCLLGELLKENGIEDIWISAHLDNAPSIKTIEKYGGIPIKSYHNICLYCAKTFINNKSKEENKITKK